MTRGYVYILTNKAYGTLYVGVTSNIQKRIREHKEKLTSGFTAKYNVNKLVYIESHPSIESAIIREKQIKNKRRKLKIELIVDQNPKWEDLYWTIV